VPLPGRVGIPGGGAGAAGWRAVAVSCGNAHTAVVLADGTLLTCGAADQGALGQDAGGGGGRRGGSEFEPVAVQGDSYSLGAVAMLSGAKSPVASASAGGLHTLALTRAGTLYGCGAGSWGRLGMGDDRGGRDRDTSATRPAHPVHEPNRRRRQQG